MKIKRLQTDDKIALFKMVDSGKLDLPKSVQNILFTEAKIDDVKISAQDQYKFLSIISTLDKDASANQLYKKLIKCLNLVQEVVKPFMDMDAINRIALFLVVLYLCSGLFTYIEAICIANVSNKFARDLRSKISFKINNLPLKYFDNHQSGDVVSRVTNDVDTIAQSINQSLASLVGSVALFVGTIIMMFITNWIFAITAILASLIGFAGIIFILSKSQKFFVARQRELGNLNGHIEEVYSGLNVVKVYNGGDLAAKKFDGIIIRFVRAIE
ncbi:MAG: ABC transporter ATP-binding protein [Bacilli bacterium]